MIAPFKQRDTYREIWERVCVFGSDGTVSVRQQKQWVCLQSITSVVHSYWSYNKPFLTEWAMFFCTFFAFDRIEFVGTFEGKEKKINESLIIVSHESKTPHLLRIIFILPSDETIFGYLSDVMRIDSKHIPCINLHSSSLNRILYIYIQIKCRFFFHVHTSIGLNSEPIIGLSYKYFEWLSKSNQ